MSGISKVKIANIALTKLGAKRITSFDDDTVPARAVNAVYDEILDEVLEEHLWTFAQKRAILALKTETPLWTEDFVTLVYAKPTDMIKLNFESVAGAIVKVEENGILSNTAELKIIYTARITDPAKYGSQFVMALATRLASELAFPLTSSVKAGQTLLADYEDNKLPKAMAADSQQGSPVQMAQDNVTNARRLGGASTLFGRTGDETWHPHF